MTLLHQSAPKCHSSREHHQLFLKIQSRHWQILCSIVHPPNLCYRFSPPNPEIKNHNNNQNTRPTIQLYVDYFYYALKWRRRGRRMIRCQFIPSSAFPAFVFLLDNWMDTVNCFASGHELINFKCKHDISASVSARTKQKMNIISVCTCFGALRILVDMITFNNVDCQLENRKENCVRKQNGVKGAVSMTNHCVTMNENGMRRLLSYHSAAIK